MPFTPLGDALHHKIDKTGSLQKQVQSALIIEQATAALQEVFGPEAGKHAKPLFLKNRTLTITCTSGAIASEIRLRQQEIVDKINAHIGKKEVDRIRYLA